MEITFKNVVEWIMKGISFVLAVSFLFGAGAFIYNKYFMDPVYSTEVKFYASGLETNVSVQRSVASQYKEFLNVRGFNEMVAADILEETGRDVSPKTIEKSLTFSSVVESTTSFFVTVDASSADLSFDIACSVARCAPKQVEGFSEAGVLEVIDEPVYPTSPSSPSALRTALIGLLLGFVISCVLVVLKEILDNRIKSPDEITTLFGIPVLGTVPDFSAAETKEGK